MDYNGFIDEVKRISDIHSDEEAVKVIRITLGTLSERLKDMQPEIIASKLPAGIDQYLKSERRGEDFTVEDFFRRVSDREMVEIPLAMLHVRSVFEVLKNALPQKTIKELRDSLPADYNTLFLKEEEMP